MNDPFNSERSSSPVQADSTHADAVRNEWANHSSPTTPTPKSGHVTPVPSSSNQTLDSISPS
jgi:hypothetical protein